MNNWLILKRIFVLEDLEPFDSVQLIVILVFKQIISDSLKKDYQQTYKSYV